MIVILYGTRPEAIKLAPVAAALEALAPGRVRRLHTGQHDRLIPHLPPAWRLPPEEHLAVLEPGQSLPRLGARVLEEVGAWLAARRPEAVVVQGDTLSACLGGLAAFLLGIPVAHVEAGLRTGIPDRPFPEETARRTLAAFARWNFAPSPGAAANLAAERTPGQIWVTGNPVVDALLAARPWLPPPPLPPKGRRRRILATLHRRENHPRLPALFAALAGLATARDREVWLPLHPHPAVQAAAQRLAGSRVRLLPPLDYLEWLAALRTADLVLSDSGGVQEEAPVLGVPLLILREETERPEVPAGGHGYLAGTDPARIRALAEAALKGRLPFRRGSPYGDGRAAPRIARLLLANLTADP
ncbi:MAG: UDP-N-acetylglucosamine 2-epimerase (non-hydrolyzing) [Firmicutes bacterium]|nr:UDP-N-acetylglucosamine 2-epimerase (non-hydrolyzing) [Bacillota bacterium]